MLFFIYKFIEIKKEKLNEKKLRKRRNQKNEGRINRVVNTEMPKFPEKIFVSVKV